MDPTIITIAETYSDRDLDRHWINENLDRAAERIAKDIPARYTDATATIYEVVQWIRDVVHAAVEQSRADCITVQTGPSLLLLGPTGSGKTHQAYGSLRALAVSGIQCRWVASTAADIYASMRPRPRVDSEEVFERYAKARLLVLDDLGAAKSSEWTEEVNYRLINYRYEHRLPTLITSNVPPRDLGVELGERVASRLVEMAARVVLKGEDRRRALAPTPRTGQDGPDRPPAVPQV